MLIQTVMFNRYHDVRPKKLVMFFTNITSQINMPRNRPCCSYQLEIFKEYAQICLKRSQKLSGSWLQLVPRYSRKTGRVDEKDPLPLLGLSRFWMLLDPMIFCYNKYVDLGGSLKNARKARYDPRKLWIRQVLTQCVVCKCISWCNTRENIRSPNTAYHWTFHAMTNFGVDWIRITCCKLQFHCRLLCVAWSVFT